MKCFFNIFENIKKIPKENVARTFHILRVHEIVSRKKQLFCYLCKKKNSGAKNKPFC
jgi:hypothetical protein